MRTNVGRKGWKAVPFEERHFFFKDWEIAPAENYMTIGRRGVQGWQIVPTEQDKNGVPRNGYTNMKFSSKVNLMKYVENLYKEEREDD